MTSFSIPNQNTVQAKYIIVKGMPTKPLKMSISVFPQ